MNAKRALSMSSNDNVAAALEDIQAGDEVRVEIKGGGALSLHAAEAIPFGFKLALTRISRGDYVVKYGERMGRAISDIEAGMQVHVHNVGGVRAQSDAAMGASQ